jgi:hypothetical protein
MTLDTAFIIFVSTGLFLYWCLRVLMMLRGDQPEISTTLENDVRRGRKVLAMLVPLDCVG